MHRGNEMTHCGYEIYFDAVGNQYIVAMFGNRFTYPSLAKIKQFIEIIHLH